MTSSKNSTAAAAASTSAFPAGLNILEVSPIVRPNNERYQYRLKELRKTYDITWFELFVLRNQDPQASTDSRTVLDSAIPVMAVARDFNITRSRIAALEKFQKRNPENSVESLLFTAAVLRASAAGLTYVKTGTASSDFVAKAVAALKAFEQVTVFDNNMNAAKEVLALLDELNPVVELKTLHKFVASPEPTGVAFWLQNISNNHTALQMSYVKRLFLKVVSADGPDGDKTAATDVMLLLSMVLRNHALLTDPYIKIVFAKELVETSTMTVEPDYSLLVPVKIEGYVQFTRKNSVLNAKGRDFVATVDMSEVTSDIPSISLHSISLPMAKPVELPAEFKAFVMGQVNTGLQPLVEEEHARRRSIAASAEERAAELVATLPADVIAALKKLASAMS